MLNKAVICGFILVAIAGSATAQMKKADLVAYLTGRSKRAWTLDKVMRNLSVKESKPIVSEGSKLEFSRDGTYSLVENVNGTKKKSSGKWHLTPHPKSKSVWVLSLGTVRYASFTTSTPKASLDELILVYPIEPEKGREYQELYWNARKGSGKGRGKAQ